MAYKCYERVNNKTGDVFAWYGRKVSRHPWKFIIVCVLTNSLLGFGLILLDIDDNTERLFTPKDNQAFNEREKVYNLFPYKDNNFYPQNLANFGYRATVIIRSKSGEGLNSDFMEEARKIYEYVKDTVLNDDGGNVTYEDICARKDSKCVVSGEEILEPSVLSLLMSKSMPFPNYGSIYLPIIFGNAKEENGSLVSFATYALRFNLVGDNLIEKKWLQKFEDRIEKIKTNRTVVAYEHTHSLDEELNANMVGDISLFVVTFTLMCTYAGLATIGGDCLSDRATLGLAGVFATVLAILGAFGLCSLCGVTFTSLVGVAPFLVVGIGVDDMFILLSGMADAIEHDTDIEGRTAHMMRTSGLGITITSLTDLFGFLIGSMSIFPAIQYFCIYTGVSILFCYINHITFLASCIVIDQRRIAALRHSKTCITIKLRDELEAEGAGKGRIYCCSGKIPRKREDVESPLESIPRRLFTRLSLCNPLKPFIFLLLLVYWGISIWGTILFEEGLLLENLAHTDSYFYKYSVWNREYYGSETIVMFVIDKEIDYTSGKVRQDVQDLLLRARTSEYIDNDFQLSWLQAYSQYPLFNTSTKEAFTHNLKLFLNDNYGKIFSNDIVFADENNTKIQASRVYVRSVPTDNTARQSKTMVATRDAAQASPLSVFAYAPLFVFFEQFVNILPQTLQTLGIVSASIFVVSFIFMPHPFIIVLVAVAVASMLTGLIGFMYFWDLTLSSITMVHIIMSIGFSVDYSAHICHAFMIGKGENRSDKVRSAMNHAGGPIFSGAFSTFMGIIVLIFSSSYIFQSFFKVMLFVIISGTVHALLFLPAIMSLIGPLAPRSTRANEIVNRINIIYLGDFTIPRPSLKIDCVSSKDSGIEKDIKARYSPSRIGCGSDR